MFLLKKFFGVAFAIFILVSIGVSQEVTLNIHPDRENGIYERGETVTFELKLEKDHQPLEGKTVSYQIQRDGNLHDEGTITTDAAGTQKIQAKLDNPSFLLCTVTYVQENSKNLKALAGAGVDPLHLASVRPEPEDFDRFWAEKMARQDAIAMDPKLVRLENPAFAEQGVEVFDLTLSALGEMPVSGYLAKPLDAKKGSHPIVVTYHGAGVYSANPRIQYAKNGALALEINAHGIANGQPKEFYEKLAQEDLRNYRDRNSDNREEIYFLGMYLRAVRAVKYMQTLPEWDGKTIIVEGSSQGGGQSLVAAGLCPEVTHCIAYVPALCFHTGFLDGMFGGWPKFLQGKTPETADPKVVETVPYVDAAIHAKRIKASCVLSVGFIDIVCSPTSVYVAYNNISTPKQIIAVPNMGHATSPEMRANAWKILEDYLPEDIHFSDPAAK